MNVTIEKQHATAAPAPRIRRRAPLGRRGLTGLVLLLLLFVAAFAVPLITGAGVNDQAHEALLSPSLQHPFGTDEVGRDIFTRTFYGLQLDFALIFLAVPLSLIIGCTLGMLRVLNRGLGELGQRVIDIILGFPSIILGLSVVAITGPGFAALFIAIVIAGVPAFGRLTRSSLLTLEHRDYIQAAKGFGVSRLRLITRHYLPNSSGPLLAQLTISLISAVILEASLSVVGLGIQPPTPSLGGLISTGLRYVYAQLGYVIGPALVFVVLATALNLIADGLSERKSR